MQCIKLPAGPNPQPEVYMMQQATQLIPRMEAGYSMDAVLRVRNCLYAHYVGPMSQSGLASQKLNILAFEHELELTGTVYTIFVNQDDERALWIPLWRRSNMTTTIRDINELQDRRIMMEKKLPPFGYALILLTAASSSSSWCGAPKTTAPTSASPAARCRPPTRPTSCPATPAPSPS